nr:coiled-coil domain-containing protein [Anoxybacillus gonensis]
MRGEIENLKQEMQSFKQEIRAEMESFKQEIRAEMQSFKQEMRAEMESFKQEMRAEMESFKQEIREEVKELHVRIGKLETKVDKLHDKFELHAQKQWQTEADVYRLKKLIGIE